MKTRTKMFLPIYTICMNATKLDLIIRSQKKIKLDINEQELNKRDGLLPTAYTV